MRYYKFKFDESFRLTVCVEKPHREIGGVFLLQQKPPMKGASVGLKTVKKGKSVFRR